MSTLNITQAAKAAGVSRNTLYKKIKKGKISTITDRKNGRVIDVSELVRVFGELEGVTGVDVQGLRHPEHGRTPKGDTVNSGVDGADLAVIDVLQARVVDLQAAVERMGVELDEFRKRENRLLGILETKLLVDKRGKGGKKRGKKRKK
ncbi:helix-turn-helix domain-containing protein [Magnetococcales bacterium HHB-1]